MSEAIGGGVHGGRQTVADRLLQQDPPQCGRSLPPAAADPHTGPAGGLHAVHIRGREDPRPRSGPGRPRKTPGSLAADKAYSNGLCRDYLRRTRYSAHDPGEDRQPAARLRKGSRGGRPPGFDEERYKQRNTVERAFNKLKHSRAVATRYDNAATFTSAPSPRQHSPSGSARDQPDKA
ncbi:hypothetical protein GCM10017687_21000 [Streptomyces echinatus]